MLKSGLWTWLCTPCVERLQIAVPMDKNTQGMTTTLDKGQPRANPAIGRTLAIPISLKTISTTRRSRNLKLSKENKRSEFAKLKFRTIALRQSKGVEQSDWAWAKLTLWKLAAVVYFLLSPLSWWTVNTDRTQHYGFFFWETKSVMHHSTNMYSFFRPP